MFDVTESRHTVLDSSPSDEGYGLVVSLRGRNIVGSFSLCKHSVKDSRERGRESSKIVRVGGEGGRMEYSHRIGGGCGYLDTIFKNLEKIVWSGPRAHRRPRPVQVFPRGHGV